MTSSGTSQARILEIQATQIQRRPIISINGANPATITVGTTYADLGATITAPQADLNLGLTVVVDNATSTDGTVQIDTSTARHAHHPLHRHRPERPHRLRHPHRDRLGSAANASASNDNSPTPTAANDNTAPTTTTTSTGQ